MRAAEEQHDTKQLYSHSLRCFALVVSRLSLPESGVSGAPHQPLHAALEVTEGLPQSRSAVVQPQIVARMTETAAEKRKRRILEKSDERMNRVMGTFGKNVGAHSVASTSLAPCCKP